MQNEIVCKNCGTHFKGNFCNWCGQKATIGRIGLNYFLHDIPHSVFHVDKGFLYTLKLMYINPGFAIKEYLEGKRIKHFRPFGFVIILSAICTILAPIIDSLVALILSSKTGLIHSTEIPTFFEKYFSLLIFLLVPIFSIVTWLSFKKKEFNYWEHFLGNTFLAAMVNFMQLSIKLLGLAKVIVGLKYNVNITFFMFAFMFYYSYAFKVWMGPKNNTNRLKFYVTVTVMNFVLAFIYVTAFSLTGVMTPWWWF